MMIRYRCDLDGPAIEFLRALVATEIPVRVLPNRAVDPADKQFLDEFSEELTRPVEEDFVNVVFFSGREGSRGLDYFTLGVPNVAVGDGGEIGQLEHYDLVICRSQSVARRLSAQGIRAAAMTPDSEVLKMLMLEIAEQWKERK